MASIWSLKSKRRRIILLIISVALLMTAASGDMSLTMAAETYLACASLMSCQRREPVRSPCRKCRRRRRGPVRR